jgi:hypothetical protein
VVENVEELRSKKKPRLLGDMKLPLQGNIRLPSPETPQYIAPKVAMVAGRRWSKCCWIKSVGHPCWSHDPDSTARYALTVTFEILGEEVVIYEPLRAAVIELQTQIEAEVEIEPKAEIEVNE